MLLESKLRTRHRFLEPGFGWPGAAGAIRPILRANRRESRVAEPGNRVDEQRNCKSLNALLPTRRQSATEIAGRRSFSPKILSNDDYLGRNLGIPPNIHEQKGWHCMGELAEGRAAR